MNRSLRVLLFAHQHAGIALLHGLRQAGHEIIACYTHPSPDARIPSLEDACGAMGIPCKVHSPTASEAGAFRDERPDLIVSALYRRRITLPFLALPRWGSINLHLGPLPQYRGMSPIPWGILNREASWAIAIHAMTHNYNEGGILRREPITLRENDNAYDIHLRCSQIGARAMIETLRDIAEGGGELAAQELREIRFFEAPVPFEGRVDWNQPAVDLAAFVRAMDFGRGNVEGGYEHLAPPAKAILNGRELGIWRARAGGTVSTFSPGTITRCDDELWVQTSRGHLVIERVCDGSDSDFPAIEYADQHQVNAGECFDTRHAWRAEEASKLGFAA